MTLATIASVACAVLAVTCIGLSIWVASFTARAWRYIGPPDIASGIALTVFGIALSGYFTFMCWAFLRA